MTPQQRQKQKIKDRIRASNYNVTLGLEPDPWVVEFRIKNNQIKANWKAKQPKKEPKQRKINTGNFKKGHAPKNKLSQEDKIKSLERHRLISKQWQIENKDRINTQRKERRNKDIDFKIKSNLRKRLSFLLRYNLKNKSKQTLHLLGCDFSLFMEHLASKFTEGMSFENYGSWHIDHIVPCYNFDMTKPEDQEKCFHYTNLQPLWAIDNLKKNRHAA